MFRCRGPGAWLRGCLLGTRYKYWRAEGVSLRYETTFYRRGETYGPGKTHLRCLIFINSLILSFANSSWLSDVTVVLIDRYMR